MGTRFVSSRFRYVNLYIGSTGNTVNTLLKEKVTEARADEWKVISEKLEIINLQLAQRKIARKSMLLAQRKIARKSMLHWLPISVCAVIVVLSILLILVKSPYLAWNHADPETTVVKVALHAFEWIFVRTVPIILIGAMIGAFLTRRKT